MWTTVSECGLGQQLHWSDEASLRQEVIPVRNRTLEWVNTKKADRRHRVLDLFPGGWVV